MWVSLVTLVISGLRVKAQDTPLISGAAAFLSTTNGGVTFIQPVIVPVAEVPIGRRFLIESRADLRGFIAPTNGNGSYDSQFFATLEYLQLDVLVNSKLTITAGRFLTPFQTYNERLTPLWIRNFPDIPLIYPIGTRTSGSSDGGMVRGDLVSKPGWQLNYAAYFSANCTAEQLQAGRSTGFRTGVFIPSKRLEIGASYERFLQDQDSNSAGVYLWWKPWRFPLQVRSEYAHGPHVQGYWIEAAYRLSQLGGTNKWIAGLQPQFRMQQFFRSRPVQGDSLPAHDTNQADFGLNYNFPHEIRLSASYSRQFTSPVDRNIWNIALTYRFLFPALPGGRHL
jgi:hypothetical protein